MPPFGVRGEIERARMVPAAIARSPSGPIAVVQQADERRDAERAGHQHHFVVRIGRQLSDLLRMAVASRNSASAETYSRTKPCKC